MGIEATHRVIAASLAKYQDQNLVEPMACTMAKTEVEGKPSPNTIPGKHA